MQFNCLTKLFLTNSPLELYFRAMVRENHF